MGIKMLFEDKTIVALPRHRLRVVGRVFPLLVGRRRDRLTTSVLRRVVDVATEVSVEVILWSKMEVIGELSTTFTYSD